MPALPAAPLIGRDAELARLGHALEEAAAGHGRLVLVGGEEGIGKTRLLEAFATEAAGRGALVLSGGCPAVAGPELAFAALVEALRPLRRRLTPGELESALGPDRSMLGRFLPALDPGTTVSHDAGMAQEGGQTELFESLLGLLERLADLRSCVVLIVEDLQWADPSTRHLMAYLARNLADVGALAVATYRTDGLVPSDPVRVLISELVHSQQIEQIELRRLGTEQTRALLTAFLGTEPERGWVAAIASRSGGIPLYVRELGMSGSRGARPVVPATLRELIMARFSAQSAAVQRMLRTAAVAGQRIEPWILADSQDLATDLDWAESVRTAVREHLLVPIEGEDGQAFEFHHPLIRELIHDDMLEPERAGIHATLAGAYARAGDAAPGTGAIRQARLAHHWSAAGDHGRALPALIRAGLAAEATFAFAEAYRAFGQALEIWDLAQSASGSEEPLMDKLSVTRHAADAADLSGVSDRAIELARIIVDQVDAERSPLAAGLALERLGRYLTDAGDTRAALATFERAAGVVLSGPPSAEQVRILGSLARALVDVSRYTRACEIARNALERGEQVGADTEIRRIRRTLGLALAFSGHVDQGLTELLAARPSATTGTEAAPDGPRVSRIGDTVRGLADLAAVLERSGRSGDAAAVAAEGTGLARQLGVEATWGQILAVQAAVGRYRLGEWDEAERATRALLEAGLRGGAAARLHVLRARLETARGFFDDAALQLQAAALLMPGRPEPQLIGESAAAHAEYAIWRGRATEARQAIDAALSVIHATEEQFAIAELCWLGIRAEADRSETARFRRAARELGESREVAAALRAELAGVVHVLADRSRVAPRDLRLLPALAEAEWARLEGAPGADGWATAVAAADELNDPWSSAYARWRGSEAILSGRGGRTRAEALVREAHATALELGARPLREQLEALARRARIDLAVTAAADHPAQPATARFRLTTRELEVLALLAAGRTNRQIADELFITEKTASHHVSNLLGKLEAATRVEAASIAHRLGLLE